MVKNTKGGSSHKKMGRKFTTGAKNNKLRLSEEEGEIYSIVVKMCGNGMFHCFGIDGVTRLGHIRGKFSGRGKRDNMVEIGKWVLIGLREWDIEPSTAKTTDKKEKMQKCDLLEVYNESDKHRLRETVDENWSLLDNNDVSRAKDVTAASEDILFASETDLEREKLLVEMKSETAEKISLKTKTTIVDLGEEEEDDEEVNFEDI
jgi:translation initiation factor IF-1